MRAAPLLLTLLCACPKSPIAAHPAFTGPPRAHKLIAEVPENETSARTAKRSDLFVTTDTGEPLPFVVGAGELGPLSRQGGRVRLYGDEAGKEGFSVDNFLLLEISDKSGTVRRVAIGFQQGLTAGSEQVDTLGGLKFAFEAGEIDLTRLLPPEDPFTIKATALDTGGVGRVSNVFLIISGDTEPVDGEEIGEKI
jgi:hypothetical protein